MLAKIIRIYVHRNLAIWKGVQYTYIATCEKELSINSFQIGIHVHIGAG